MTIKSDLKALEALANSRGWALIRERMEAEAVQAALMLGDRRDMTEQQIHFQRGAIWAAKQLIDIPAKMKALLQSQLPFEPDLADAGKSKPDDKLTAPPLTTSDETPR